MFSSTTQCASPITVESTQETESDISGNIEIPIEAYIKTVFDSGKKENLNSSTKNSNPSEIFELQHSDSISIQSSVVYEDHSLETPIKSAFTPLRKREHSVEDSPVCYTHLCEF